MNSTLGTYPTPCERFPLPDARGTELWTKRDDLSSPVYGGSKVRKLEPLLAEARRRGATRLLTLGAAGSHHVLACSIFGHLAGLDVAAVLVPQPRTDHAVDDLRAAIGAGLEPIASSYVGVPFHVMAQLSPRTYLVPFGGSNAVGARAFVAATNELLDQVANGEVPEPDEIVVTLGSGGTAAGLLAGLALAKSRTRLVAVGVSPPASLVQKYVLWLAAKLSGLAEEELAERIEVVTDQMGAGYGHGTLAGEEATEVAARAGLALDPTYTAKAFAASLARAKRGDVRKILYWHTLSSASLDPWITKGPTEAALPAELRQLFR